MRLGARVAAVVVNYRHNDDTVRCIHSLQSTDYLDMRIIVVDNTESAVSTQDLRGRLDPSVTVLEPGRNLGFAGGSNVGITAALDGGAEYVWLVNPDAVVGSSTLSSLLAAAEEHPDAAVVGARILDHNHPSKILFNGGVINAGRGGATFHQDAGRLDRDVPDGAARDVDYVTGACFLVRRNAIGQLGLLPEEYFRYFEETDYCVRARAAGWRTIIAPHARVWQFKRSTSTVVTPSCVYYMCRNRLHFGRRFFAADFDESIADLRSFVTNIRKSVKERFPHSVGRFDKLVELAFDDARQGRFGRREDIDDLDFA